MQRTLVSALFLLMATLMVVSCSEEETTTVSSDCYISTFTLGYVKRTVHTTSSTGGDSTYTISFSGSYYPTIIDQRQHLITNAESLPVETQLTAVLASISGTGTIKYSADPNAAEWTTFSESDSINFEQPMYFRVWSSDGLYSRTYKVVIKVRSTDYYCYTWKQETSLPTDMLSPDIADMMKACVLDGKMMIFSKKGSNIYLTQGNRQTDGTMMWQTTPCEGTTTGDLTTLQVFKGELYMSTPTTEMLSTTDGIHWTSHTLLVPSKLIAATDTALYAIQNDTIVRTKDFTELDTLDLEYAFSTFPTNITSVSYFQTNGSRRILVAGESTTNPDSVASVWGFLESVSTYLYLDPWTYYNWASDNRYVLPLLKHLNILYYDDALWAFGGNALHNGGNKALDAFYGSYDGGITWIADEYLTLPTAYQSLIGTTRPIAAAVDANEEYFWLFVGKDVFTIRANSFDE